MERLLTTNINILSSTAPVVIKVRSRTERNFCFVARNDEEGMKRMEGAIESFTSPILLFLATADIT